MKRLIAKAFLFLLPFIIWELLELFVLPPDLFMFRAWEVMQTNLPNGWNQPAQDILLPGPFLPNQHLVKLSTGDYRRDNSPVKVEEWWTDRYGYRNFPRDPEPAKYAAVLIGDSHIAGSFVTQTDRLSEVMERQLGKPVYNQGKYGWPDLFWYLRQQRFAEHPPDVVVFELRETDLTDDRLPPLPGTLKPDVGDIPTPAWAVLWVRFERQPLLNWMRARLKVPGDELLAADPPRKLDPAEAAKRLAAYETAIEARGSRFVALLLPSPYSTAETYTPVVKGFAAAGLPFVALPLRQNNLTYFNLTPDGKLADSHWNESTIVETANLLLKNPAFTQHHDTVAGN
jgi:hypothetical protein